MGEPVAKSKAKQTFPYKAEIEWIDHATTMGWVPARDRVTLVKMRSFAWVISESKEKVVITDTMDEGGNSRYPLAIGRKLITKIKKIK